jgi:histidinol-phosphate phosphatase family protein
MNHTGLRQAVILAGGQGTRLRPLTFKTPKPMIRIHDKPFLEYIINLLKQNGIKKVVILTGYLHEQIEEYFKNGSKFGISISYSYSPVADDTGTRIRKAKKLVDDEFLLLYSDNYWPLKLKQLYTFYKEQKVLGVGTIYANLDKYSENNIHVSEDGLVTIYDKKKLHKDLNGVDTGFFIFNKRVLNLIPNNNCSFETTVLPKLINKKQLAGFLTHHKYYGLSNLSRIPVIEDFFTPKKVVFLDRDGVINKKASKAEYITEIKDFVFLPKVKQALKMLQKKGYMIFVITNQPGIARKMLTGKKLQIIHRYMEEELKKIGVEIKEIFVCKHGWDEKCFCRKPNPGMFFQAAQKYNIDLYKSYCIGDDDRDIIAGQMAGCKTFKINSTQDLHTIVKKYL